MSDTQTRQAATPSVGAARGFVRVLLTAIVGSILAGIPWLAGAANKEVITAAVGLLMLVAVMPGLEAWGKYLRERGINALFCLPLCLLVAGCIAVVKPPVLAFGDTYFWSCDGTTTFDPETQMPLCDGILIEVRGGVLSIPGANVLTGAVGLARSTALMAAGMPPVVGRPPATPIPE